ncbi:MAG: D-alanine--D-alanine ligase [Gammaproteobacteria bacterium]|nr:D-alanine--D-alanine ligase [Gammaproteobacteria bacterium]|tara:strand:+ start:2368 stop:3276 length:909 start_codon:yes stop_codon:yes gene_type:complete
MEDMKEVCVLHGGNSSEREVSLKSGKFIHKSLLKNGYKSYLIDYADLTELEKLKDFDLVFIALHGEEGESGILQSKMDKAGIYYTGSGFEACKNSWDKEICKNILSQRNIPTPDFSVYKTFQEIVESKNKIEEQFHEGVFIKPCKEGSSIDIIKVTDFSKTDLEKIKVDLVDREREFLVERFIEGREFTVGFLNDHILEPLEIITKREFYDYEAKYDDDETQIIKADLDEKDLDTLKVIAKNCFNVFGLSRWGRVDILQDQKGNFFVLELNTVPGMTDHSLFPYAASLMGFSFDELVNEIAK